MAERLTEAQIEQARGLRKEGKTYPEIAKLIGTEINPDSIRGHCQDLATAPRARVTESMVGKDGRIIVPFTDQEDAVIIAWVNWNPMDATITSIDGPLPVQETMAALAKRMERRRHSVAARIRTLRKHGKIK